MMTLILTKNTTQDVERLQQVLLTLDSQTNKLLVVWEDLPANQLLVRRLKALRLNMALSFYSSSAWQSAKECEAREILFWDLARSEMSLEVFRAFREALLRRSCGLLASMKGASFFQLENLYENDYTERILIEKPTTGQRFDCVVNPCLYGVKRELLGLVENGDIKGLRLRQLGYSNYCF